MESKSSIANTTMTITRALAELKLLDKRLTKAITTSTFTGTTVSGFNTTIDAGKMKASWQSFNDLLKRYHTIKNAILDSNSRTKVSIGGVEYTVAEAIAKKDSSKYDKDMLSVIRSQRLSVENEVSRHNENVQRKLDDLINLTFNERTVDGAELKTLRETYLANNKIEVVDPLNLASLIETRQNEYDEFMSEVDFCLSESNARTIITF